MAEKNADSHLVKQRQQKKACKDLTCFCYAKARLGRVLFLASPRAKNIRFALLRMQEGARGRSKMRKWLAIFCAWVCSDSTCVVVYAVVLLIFCLMLRIKTLR